jgi:hypothetical protein
MNEGTLSRLCRLEDRITNAIGLAKAKARWTYHNMLTSSTPSWEAYNRHMWRVEALYFGGDVEMGEFPGGIPGQRLWNYRQPAA